MRAIKPHATPGNQWWDADCPQLFQIWVKNSTHDRMILKEDGRRGKCAVAHPFQRIGKAMLIIAPAGEGAVGAIAQVWLPPAETDANSRSGIRRAARRVVAPAGERAAGGDRAGVGSAGGDGGIDNSAGALEENGSATTSAVESTNRRAKRRAGPLKLRSRAVTPLHRADVTNPPDTLDQVFSSILGELRELDPSAYYTNICSYDRLRPHPSLLASGRRPERARGPAALAPLPGERQVVGEVSGAAEAHGVRRRDGRSARRSPAARRCAWSRPTRPAPPSVWDRVLLRLEGIGAAVESERAGEAFFAVDGLRGLYGGELEGVLAAARGGGAGAGADRRRPQPLRRPSAARAAPRRRGRRRSPAPALCGLPRPAAGRVAARPGSVPPSRRPGAGRRPAAARPRHPRQARGAHPRPGRRSLRAARPAGAAPRPRRGRRRCARATPREELAAEIELPEGAAGSPARPRPGAAGRAPARRAAADASGPCWRCASRPGSDGGGSWSVEQGLGRPTASARTIGALLVAAARGPARRRRRAAAAGARPSAREAADQLELSLGGREPRRGRLAAAVREVRAAAGAEALLKVIAVDPALARPRAPRPADALPGAMSRAAAHLRAAEPAAVERDRRRRAAARSTGSAVEAIREEWLVEDRWWTRATPAPPLLRAGPRRRPQRDRLPRRPTAGAGFASGPDGAAAPYVELHAHSAFSFLDGASTPTELAGAAAALGYPAIALTDHDGVWGSMEFAHACARARACGRSPAPS